eukprot:SM001449S00655  [mRNA]  locus=s1449:1075:1798:- [translate_table: standard]
MYLGRRRRRRASSSTSARASACRCPPSGTRARRWSTPARLLAGRTTLTPPTIWASLCAPQPRAISPTTAHPKSSLTRSPSSLASSPTMARRHLRAALKPTLWQVHRSWRPLLLLLTGGPTTSFHCSAGPLMGTRVASTSLLQPQ